MEIFQVIRDIQQRLKALEAGFRRLTGLATIPTFTGSTEDLTGTISAAQMPALTGDVTSSAGSVATTIANDAVTNAKAANMADATLKGRASGAGTGDPTDLTGTQATVILDVVVGDSGSGGTKGLVPAPAAGDSAAGKFLKASGLWVVPSGGGGSGDVVGPSSAVDAEVVLYDGTTGKLIKRATGTGPVKVISGVFGVGAIDLSGSEVTGNLGVSHLNSGTGATSGTFWCGDGTWALVSGSSVIFYQETILTHSQISNLSTTAIDVITAPGAGLTAHPVFFTTSSDFSAAAYTSNPNCRFRYNGDATDIVTSFTNMLNNATKRTQYMPALSAAFSTSACQNKAVQISTSAAVTGGNAANQFKIRAFFTLMTDL